MRTPKPSRPSSRALRAAILVAGVAALPSFVGCGSKPAAKVPAPVASAPPARADGRLPALASPSHYSLELTVDPTTPKFSGVVRIDAKIPSATRHVVLHADELRVTKAHAVADGKVVPAKTSVRNAAGAQTAEELVLAFDEPVTGEVVFELEFDGDFSPTLGGLYRVHEGDKDYAFTQFEATDARRAFPCFDEPAFKVPFDVRIHAPKGMIAVANTKEIGRKEDATGATFQFATTKPLPTYLVAFAVGDFDVVEGRKAGAPIRVITAKGKGGLGQLALDETTILADKLGEYFDFPYPYDKLDVVAVPNFGPGAMENPGLVTFREEILLLDPKRASLAARRRQTLTIAHELAHQWFGDLVTMEWWNDLWLNEGFATWMEARIVDDVRPTFGARIENLADALEVMDEDSLPSARAVRGKIATVSELASAFDGITYTKGAAILAMLESWLGPETFQKGVRDYVKTHAWKNATAADLFAALGKASSKDVAAVAATFLDQPGVPRVKMAVSCEKGKPSELALEQAPWRAPGLGDDRAAKSDPKTWKVPVCVKSAGAKTPACTLLDGAGPTKVGLDQCPKFLAPNAEESAYYRWSLDKDSRAKLLANAHDALDVRSRLGLLSNLWAGVRSGDLPASEFVAALPKFDAEYERAIVLAQIDVLRAMKETLVTDEAKPAFAAFAKARLDAMRRALAATKGQKDKVPEEDRELTERALFAALGDVADDKATLEEAEKTTKLWLDSPEKVPSEVARAAVGLASRGAGDARLDALRKAMATAKTPEDRGVALRAMFTFKDEAVLKRALSLALTDEIKLQDLRYVVGAARADAGTRKVLFGWMVENWDALKKKLHGKDARRFLAILGDACTTEERDRMRTFFESKAPELEGATRPLAEALESSGVCVALRERASGDASHALQKAKR
ncbi:MAG: M1 family metallopeptidase [Polyangiaceae bacterium]